MIHSEKLRFTTIDSNGDSAPTDLMETRWLHSGSGKVYEIYDFIWNGADDTWMLLMADEEDEETPGVCRPLSHLHGNRDNGAKRYTQIVDVT